MDAGVAEADRKREEQRHQFVAQGDDPESQLKGLMTAQQSLKRISSAFASRPNEDKIKDMAKKLGVPFMPELMQLGNNEEISGKLVEMAVEMGKSESEIAAALGA